MSTITVANGKPISSIQTTASLSGSDKFVISRGLSNYAVSYTNLISELAGDIGLSLPLTTNGDLLTRSGGVNTRLGIGTAGQVLTVSSGLPSWQTLSLYTDPLTTNGDIIRRAGGVTTRLAAGTNGQVLTISGGLPVWSTPAAAGFADPLTTNGDIIARIAGVTTRVGIGSSGQYLRVNAGIPTWQTVNVFTDPLTTNGDIIARVSGVTTRVPIGTSGQVLTVSGGVPSWVTPSSYADPLTTNGDLVARISGATTRLPVGTNGQYLSISGGLPTWVNAPFLDTPVISGTQHYLPKFATTTTLGDSSILEGTTEITIGKNLDIKPSSATSLIRIGSFADANTASNSAIKTSARTLEIGQNITNTFDKESASSIKMNGSSLSILAGTDASIALPVVADFNTASVSINKNTSISGSLTTSGLINLKGSVLDVVSNKVEVRSTGGIKTVEPGGTIVTSNSGSWKLGKKYADGSGMTISATDYIEVDIDGTKYKLAIIGSGGGSGGSPSTTNTVTLQGIWVDGETASFYYAITSTTTPPAEVDYIPIYSLGSSYTTDTVTIEITDEYYLWVYFVTSSGLSSSVIVDSPVIATQGGGDTIGYAQARYFRIMEDGSISLTISE